MTNQTQLTTRELHVVYEALKGKSTREIADSLFITQHTVKAHLKKIFYKSGTSRRIEFISKLFSFLLDEHISKSQLDCAIKELILKNMNKTNN